VGTLMGVAVATGIDSFIRPTGPALIWLAVASVLLAYYLFPVEYSLFAFSVTLFVVFSLSSRGTPGPEVGLIRLGATVVGCVFSLAAAVLWPIWESRQVQGVIADAFRAQAEYGQAVLARADGHQSPDLVAVQRKARTLRLEAEKLVETASLEPRGGQKGRLEKSQENLALLTQGAAEMLFVHAQLTGRLAQEFSDRSELKSILGTAIERDLRLAEAT
ncbi:MAG: FUSC family protein, partial [Armatimonadota bacterium]